MVNFGSYLSQSQVPAYSDKYIPYDSLKQSLENANKIGGKDDFYRKLEVNIHLILLFTNQLIQLFTTSQESYIICKSFAEKWLHTLEKTYGNPMDDDVVSTTPSVSSTENTNSFVSECLELNQFIFINQEALRKIIKKHDKNSSGTNTRL